MFSAITKKSVLVKALSKMRSTVLVELLSSAANTIDGKNALDGLAKRLTESIDTIAPKNKEQADMSAEIVALCSLFATDEPLITLNWWSADCYSKTVLAVCLAVTADTEQGSRMLLKLIKQEAGKDSDLAYAATVALGKRWILAPESPTDWVPL